MDFPAILLFQLLPLYEIFNTQIITAVTAISKFYLPVFCSCEFGLFLNNIVHICAQKKQKEKQKISTQVYWLSSSKNKTW